MEEIVDRGLKSARLKSRVEYGSRRSGLGKRGDAPKSGLRFHRNRSRFVHARDREVVRSVVGESQKLGDFQRRNRAEQNPCQDREDELCPHSRMDSPRVNWVASLM